MERLSDGDRWEAVRTRASEAPFLFAVRTTGIVCRPGCASRLPTRANVVYFDDIATATGAGFRPCKRCAPDDLSAGAARERLVARACEMLAAEDAPPFSRIAGEVGVSRYHFTRIFRAVAGLTPGDYLDARRRRRLSDALSRGEAVTRAIQGAGYGAASRMYERRGLGMTPTAYRSRGAGERVRYVLADGPFGVVLVARTADGICAIENGADGDALVGLIGARFSAATLERDRSRAFASAVEAAIAAGDVRTGALPAELRVELFCERLRIGLRDAATRPPVRSRTVRRSRRPQGSHDGVR